MIKGKIFLQIDAGRSMKRIEASTLKRVLNLLRISKNSFWRNCPTVRSRWGSLKKNSWMSKGVWLRKLVQKLTSLLVMESWSRFWRRSWGTLCLNKLHLKYYNMMLMVNLWRIQLCIRINMESELLMAIKSTGQDLTFKILSTLKNKY